MIHTYEFDVGGLVINPGRMLAGYDWFLMIFTLFSGVQILLIAHTGDRRLIKQMAIVNLVMVALLFIVTAVKIPPPLVLFALIWVMMLLSLLTAEKSRRQVDRVVVVTGEGTEPEPRSLRLMSAGRLP